MRWLEESAIRAVLSGRMMNPPGSFNAADVAAPPSPRGVVAPARPAIVEMRPLEMFTKRIACPLNSTMYKLPAESNCRSKGQFTVELRAGPESPDEEADPLRPTTVVMIPLASILRTELSDVKAEKKRLPLLS